MAQETHQEPHFENVCLTGTVVMAAFAGGLLVSAIIFAHAFWVH